jgi:hypothetical protein
VKEDRVAVRRAGLFWRFPERLNLVDRGGPGVEHLCCTGCFQTGSKLYVPIGFNRTKVTGSPLITPLPGTLPQYCAPQAAQHGATAELAFGIESSLVSIGAGNQVK